MQIIKAIVSDFDGTAAGKDWTISEPVVQSIKTWTGSGRSFLFATGKQYKHIRTACIQLRLSTPQIVRGGAEIVDGKSGDVIVSSYMNPLRLHQLIPILKQSKIPFTAETGDILYTLDGKSFGAVPGVRYKSIDLMSYENIAKIVLWTDNCNEHEVESFVNKHIKPEFSSFEITKSYTPYQKTWQITSASATKKTAVTRVARLLGISSEEIAGIGDGYNDISLLEACGYKVATTNAPRALKRIADQIIPDVERNGVALFIRNFLGA